VDVAEPDVVERLELLGDAPLVAKKLERVVDGHVEHVGDALALVAHLERLAVVALALAHLARHVDVGQEVHLDLHQAVALARLAAAALHVEREAPGRSRGSSPPGSAVKSSRIGREQPGVGGRDSSAASAPIGLWSMSITLSISVQPSIRVCARDTWAPVEVPRERLVQDVGDRASTCPTPTRR
jgi:hypothetical protein